MTATQSLTLALLCGSLVMSTGCTRTSDGSVVMAQPVTLSLNAPFLGRRDDRGRTPDRYVQAFPPPPQAAPQPRRTAPRKRVVPRVAAWKPSGVAAPFVGSQSAKPLACHDEAGANGRVRVVCE